MKSGRSTEQNTSTISARQKRLLQAEQFENNFGQTKEVREIIELLRKDPTSEQQKQQLQRRYNELILKINGSLVTHQKSFNSPNSINTTRSRSPSPRSIQQTPSFENLTDLHTPIQAKKNGDFTYRAITANCIGSGKTLGKGVAPMIQEAIRKEPADCYIINCQNAMFSMDKKDPILSELINGLPRGYTVERVAKMSNSQTNKNTGMACYVIHKEEFLIKSTARSKARGHDYKHGGMISRFSIQKNNEKPIVVESVSAHLSKDKSVEDWYAVNHTLACDPVTNWDDLCNIAPNMRLSGMKTNIDNKTGKSRWDTPDDFPDTWALAQTSIGDQVVTGIQHKSNLITISNSANDPTKTTFSGKPQSTATPLNSNPNVLMSDILTTSSELDDFTRVKHHLANQLQASAPTLAENICELDDEPESRNTLIKIHNTYLSNSGVLDFKLKQAAHEKVNKKSTDAFKGEAWLADVTLANAFERSDLTDRLIANIGNYGKLSSDEERKKLELLSDDAKAALLAKKVKYNKPSIFDLSDDPQRHRKAFIKYIMQLDGSLLARDETKRNQLIAEGKIEEAAITMEALLGKEGIRLYKKALEEERNDPEYMYAVFCKSTKHYKGRCFKHPVAIPVGGPSGAGKSYNAQAIVKALMDIDDNVDRNDNSGNDVVSIDGGIARDVSQMRKLAIQLANKKNHTFILDLESKSKALGSVKESVDNAARIGDSNGQPLSTVIPLTFSDKLLDTQVHAYFDGLDKTYGKGNCHFSMVTEVDPATVKNQGIARSAETEFTNTQGEYDLNKATCESKKYSEGIKITPTKGISFLAGEKGSENAERIYFERNRHAVSLHVANPLRLYTPKDPNNLNGNWVPTDDYAAPYALRIHKEVFSDWLLARQLNKTTLGLIEYNNAHRGDEDYAPEAVGFIEQNGSIIEQTIGRASPLPAVNPPAPVVNVRQVEADTIKTLLGSAKAQIQAPNVSLCFDPQGRVLVDVAECIVQVVDTEPDVALQQEILAFKKVVLIRRTNADDGAVTWAIGHCNREGHYIVTNLDSVPDKIAGLAAGAVVTDLASLDTIRQYLPAEKMLAHTTVSYDICALNAIKERFKYNIQRQVTGNQTRKDAIYNAYNAIEHKSSIIPLQQEFHFHLRLALRAYAKQVVDITPEQFQQIHGETMQAVNTHVMDAFGKALQAAYVHGEPNGSINIAVLNESLDKARKTIAPLAHQALFANVKAIANGGNNITALSSDEIDELKHTAETTTATSNDLLHTDNAMGLVTRFSGTDVTAHDRNFGSEHVADIQVQAYDYNPDDLTTLAAVDQKTHVGVPSLAVKDINGLIKGKGDVELNFPPIITRRAINRNNLTEVKSSSDNDFKQWMRESLQPHSKTIFIQDEVSNKIYCRQGKTLINVTTEQAQMLVEFVLAQDVKDKLAYLSDKYFSETPAPVDGNNKPDAFVYNLYTSINSGATGYIDEVRSKNFQTESLKAILMGALLHNKKGKPYCFVQAIAVNGYGDKLGYDGQNMVRREATLMTEMALLHTIYDAVSDEDLKGQIDLLFQNYDTFLEGNKLWFSGDQSDPIDQIRNIKLRLMQNKLKQGSDNTQLLAQKCLAKMLANNGHHTNDGRLIQALSVFCEKGSINGCKSRNERTQMVNSRVQLLEADNADVLAALRGYIAYPVTVSFAQLEQAFDTQCNKCDLYGAVSLISNNDQGAAAKINPRGFVPNTNNAEAKEMTHLYQDNAKKMQAHNGLTDSMVKAVKDSADKVSLLDKVKDAMTVAYNKLPTLPSLPSMPSLPSLPSLASIKTQQPRVMAATIAFVLVAVIVSAVVPPLLPVFVGLGVGAMFAAGYREKRLSDDDKAFKKEQEEEFIGSDAYMGDELGGRNAVNNPIREPEEDEVQSQVQPKVQSQVTENVVHDDTNPTLNP